MPSSYAPQRGQMCSGETRVFSVDFGASTGSQTGKLDTGRLLTGTPTVVVLSIDPATATTLTLANKTVNAGTITINGRSCLAGEAVQFTGNSPLNNDGTVYVVKITATDDGTPAQTLIGFVDIDVSDG